MKKAISEIVNMVMIYDGDDVVVLDRKKSWPGLTFPGGHVEPGESFYDSAVREAKEETGLDVKDLVPCGVVHWASKDGRRYIEFLYKTCRFDGKLIDRTDEGEIFWMKKDELLCSDKKSPNFKYYLPMFFEDKYSEMFLEWDGKSFEAVPRYI